VGTTSIASADGADPLSTELASPLWREWSPAPRILNADFERTAPSFENPDFVDFVIHSLPAPLRARTSAAEYEADERFLSGLATVEVPAIVLDPTEDPALLPRPRDQHLAQFPHLLDYRQISSGHN
jgi:hypothetical protein